MTADNDNSPLIFILDDEPAVVNSIALNIAARRRALIRAFYTAGDMLKSKDLARVDLFILDIKLGDHLTGFDIPARLPAACRFAAYLFISGWPVNDADFAKAGALPFFDFLQKPFGAVKFMHRVELLLAARTIYPDDIDPVAGLGDLPPFVAAVLDHKLIIRLCNGRFAELLEVKDRQSLIGRNWVDFLPADLAAHLTRRGGRIDLSQKGEFHAPITTTTGAIRRVMWFNSPFIDENGRDLTLIVGIPGRHRLRMIGHLRQQWQKDIIKHRAAIRALRKMPLTAPTGNQCPADLIY